MRLDIRGLCRSRFDIDLARGVRLWRGRQCAIRGRGEDDLDCVLGVNGQFDGCGEGILGVEDDFGEYGLDAFKLDCALVVVHGGQSVTGRSLIEERLVLRREKWGS